MMDETGRFDQGDINVNKGLACLSYLSILFIIPLLVNRQSPFTKFHINQGIVLFIIEVIGGIVGGILGWIPFIGWIITTAISIIMLVLSIMGLVNTLNGRALRLPVIGNIEIFH